MSGSVKTIAAATEFVDIAGLVKGASKGEGLGNKFLSNIREVDAIVHVVRVFGGDAITHVHDSVDPLRDIEIIETELTLADLETVDKTVSRLEKNAKGNDKNASAQLEIVQKVKSALESGALAQSVDLDFDHEPTKIIVREMALLTMKPILYVYNVSDVAATLDAELESRPHIKLDIKIEEELMEMSAEEAKELEMESHIDELVTAAYKLLQLQTFFTTGETESRAWTVKIGATAPEAGAAIHSDFQDKFICADVINWQKLLDAGSWSAARDAGAIQTVGKEHVMEDGDVVEFKHG